MQAGGGASGTTETSTAMIEHVIKHDVAPSRFSTNLSVPVADGTEALNCDPAA